MKIGILGGGQLAQMLIQNEIAKKHEFLIYTSELASSTEQLAPQIIASYLDKIELEKFAKHIDVVTFETETIPVEAIEYINKFTKVYPNQKSLACFQDRLFEKQFFSDLEIPTNKFVQIDDNSDLFNAADQLKYPFIIKARRDGYDGKLQWHVPSKEKLFELMEMEKLQKCIAEEFIHFDREVSIIGARAVNGEMRFYDLCENVHKNGILRYTIIKGSDPLQAKAEQYLRKAAEALNYVGVLAIEFFVSKNQLLVNEAAPRVHNSGHWTIEGALTSQFANHVRAITGQPLGPTDSKGHLIMYNFIGSLDHKDKLDSLNMAFHDYHKLPRAKRKLAHSTLVAQSEFEFDQALDVIKRLIS